MKIKSAKWHQGLAALGVAGAAVALPLVGTANAAHVDADIHIFGSRHDRRDYGPRVVVGVVTRHLHGNYFEVQTDEGRFISAVIHDGGPISFGLNERVELTGHFSDGNFVADTVRFLREDRRDDFRDLVKMKFDARVLEIRSAHRLVVRNEYGRVYDVDAVNGFSDAIRVGDHIRVIGYGNDRFMRADTIRR